MGPVNNAWDPLTDHFLVETRFSMRKKKKKRRRKTQTLGEEMLSKRLHYLQTLGGVWYTISNNHFQFLNNIIRIFTHFFTHTYFHTYFQITKNMFLSACTKQSLKFSIHSSHSFKKTFLVFSILFIFSPPSQHVACKVTLSHFLKK